MTRPLLARLGTFAALLLPLVGVAQGQPATPETQLDRMERGLGEVLRRLDALEARGRESGTPSPAPAAAAASPARGAPEGYRPGAVLVLRPAPTADALLVPPADALLSSVHAGGPLRLFTPGPGGRPSEPAGVEVQGWLRITEPGRHQLVADLAFARQGGYASAPCAAVLWLEERRAASATGELGIGLGRPGTLSLLLGADLAAPGLYRTRLWLACARGNASAPTPPVSADLSLRAPSDSAPRGVTGTDLVHREG